MKINNLRSACLYSLKLAEVIGKIPIELRSFSSRTVLQPLFYFLIEICRKKRAKIVGNMNFGHNFEKLSDLRVSLSQAKIDENFTNYFLKTKTNNILKCTCKGLQKSISELEQ